MTNVTRFTSTVTLEGLTVEETLTALQNVIERINRAGLFNRTVAIDATRVGFMEVVEV